MANQKFGERTPEIAKQIKEGREKKMALRGKMNIPPMSKAIKLHCQTCICGTINDVKVCSISRCALFPFRFGRNPKPDDLRVAKFNKEGDFTGWGEYMGYMNKGVE